jgi:hypothetical protein
MAFGTGTMVIVRQAFAPGDQFGEYGGWIIGVLLFSIGALIAFGIRDFQHSHRRTDEKLEKLEDQVFSRINELSQRVDCISGDLREHMGRNQAVDELASRLTSVLLAEKKRPLRAVNDGITGSRT